MNIMEELKKINAQESELSELTEKIRQLCRRLYAAIDAGVCQLRISAMERELDTLNDWHKMLADQIEGKLLVLQSR